MSVYGMIGEIKARNLKFKKKHKLGRDSTFAVANGWVRAMVEIPGYFIARFPSNPLLLSEARSESLNESCNIRNKVRV